MILVDSHFNFPQYFLRSQHILEVFGLLALSLAVAGDIFADGRDCEGAQLLCEAPKALFGMSEVV